MNQLARLTLRHRRLLASVCAGLAVLLTIAALRPDVDRGRQVVVAAHDLPSGTVVTSGDVRRVAVSPAPAHSATRVDEVVGRTIAGPMRRGEALTDTRVLHADRMAGFPDGTVLATVRLADDAALSTIRVGEHVDVVAVDPDARSDAQVVARDVEVVALPSPDDDRASGVALRVATTEETALQLAREALRSRLSVLTAGS